MPFCSRRTWKTPSGFTTWPTPGCYDDGVVLPRFQSRYPDRKTAGVYHDNHPDTAADAGLRGPLLSRLNLVHWPTFIPALTTVSRVPTPPSGTHWDVASALAHLDLLHGSFDCPVERGSVNLASTVARSLWRRRETLTSVVPQRIPCCSGPIQGVRKLVEYLVGASQAKLVLSTNLPMGQSCSGLSTETMPEGMARRHYLPNTRMECGATHHCAAMRRSVA